MPHLHPAPSSKDHSLGPETAAVTLVEYGDYQCPHCLTARRIVEKLTDHFEDRLRFVYRHFPLTEMHPMAEPAAEAAEFAAAADKFWPMHHSLYGHQSRLSLETLPELAAELCLDAKAATKAIATCAFAARIEEDTRGGVRSGVHGTPTFFVNGVPFTGSVDYEGLAEAIEAAESA